MSVAPSSPAPGREALPTDVWHLQLFIDSEIQTSEPSSAEATASAGLAKKIMKCSGLWLCDGVSGAASSGAAEASCECVYGSLGIQRWFYFYAPGAVT